MSILDRIKLRIGGREREVFFISFSLILALVIWFLTNLSHEYSGTVSIPVVAKCNIDGHKGVSSNTALVSARVRTTGFLLVRDARQRDRKPVVVQFDRADLRHTRQDTWAIIGGAKNSYINQIFGEGAVVEAFITDTLNFVFPPENHKKVPVEVPLTATCSPQYMQSGPFKVVPDSVTVYADDIRLESIEKITTSRVVLDRLSQTSRGVLKLVHPKDVRISHEQVSYELPVSRYVELKGTFSVEVWNAPAGHEVQVFPATADVIMRCAFPLSKDPMSSLRLYIDYKDFTASASGKCVAKTMKLPPGVLDIRTVPEVFDCLELR